MPGPTASAAQIEQLTEMTAQFIQQQRDKYFASARPMTVVQRKIFEPFFPAHILRETRFSEKIEDPPFYPMVGRLGIDDLPKANTSAAITYVHVIVAQEEYTDHLRFHELVHAVQYRELGVTRFANAYVRGFLSGGGYYGIPLEKNAYELDGRFATDPKAPFDVLSEVRKWKF